jgi:hypothetical protein
MSLFIWACRGGDVPKGVFSQEKMEAVLYDIIRADEYADQSGLTDSAFRRPAMRMALYDSVFHLHSIDKKDYEKSMKFYESRPDLLKVILDSLHSKTDPAKNVKVVDSL